MEAHGGAGGDAELAAALPQPPPRSPQGMGSLGVRLPAGTACSRDSPGRSHSAGVTPKWGTPTRGGRRRAHGGAPQSAPGPTSPRYAGDQERLQPNPGISRSRRGGLSAPSPEASLAGVPAPARSGEKFGDTERPPGATRAPAALRAPGRGRDGGLGPNRGRWGWGMTVEGVPTCSGGGRRRAQPRGAARGGGRTRGCGSPRPSRRAGREREAGRETQPEPSKSQRWSRPPRRAGLQLLTASGGEPCPCRRRRAALPGPGGSQRLGADPPGTARLGSARRRPGRGARRGAVRFGLARSGPDVIGSVCRGSVWFGSVQFRVVHLGSVRLGSVLPGGHRMEQ